MKLLNSKKASESQSWWGDATMFMILLCIVLGFVAVALVLFFAESSSAQTIAPKNIETDAIIKRLLESPYCFVYEDNGVVMNGIIDYAKFNEGTLRGCYNTDSNALPALRVTLISSTVKDIQPIHTKNWNINSGFQRKTRPYSILIYYNTKIHNGEMTIEIQNNK